MKQEKQRKTSFIMLDTQWRIYFSLCKPNGCLKKQWNQIPSKLLKGAMVNIQTFKIYFDPRLALSKNMRYYLKNNSPPKNRV
jgi:hypothetical protein